MNAANALLLFALFAFICRALYLETRLRTVQRINRRLIKRCEDREALIEAQWLTIARYEGAAIQARLADKEAQEIAQLERML